ncbi:alpha/beta hydrolase family protein [Crossiella sp. SN42]|uniref:alpha/beta hydrolase n=1 Tax=Crossiella sp. SN42 TaxID=2944808 RepID=UPI00207D6116|nr:alpha/beta hydrolase [Crossiella sp. SN42]MCO1580931.1 alpha/beta hydrolase family protein [Crossiella sp. SN42]
MPIAEPSSPLWALVRLRVPWPDTDEDQVDELARRWTSSAGSLGQTIEKVERTGAEVTGVWPDAAGLAMAGKLRDSAEFRRIEAEMTKVADDAGRFAAEVRGTKQAIAQYIEESTPGFAKTFLLTAPALGVAAPLIYAGQVADQVEQLVADAAERISGGFSASTVPEPLGGLTPPPPGGSPEANAAWWKGLSEADRQAIIREQPEWIGNLDGIPFAARDQANRLRLDIERDRLLAERAELIRQYENSDRPFLNWDREEAYTEHQKRLAAIDAKLASVEAVRDVSTLPGRSVLLLDTQGERVEAAIGNGDVDEAKHVAVFTPGLTSTVDGSLRGYDADLNALRERSLAVLKQNGRDGETVATVTWIGYQAPQLTGDSLFNAGQTVLLDQAARAGADKLAPFLRGIDAAREVDPELTALGHSYGSTTTGLALLQGTGVDRAAVWGSPGVGTLDPGQLGLSPDRVLVQETRDDPVADAGAFGGDPSQLPAIHGEPGAAPSPYPGEAPRLPGSGHSGYSVRHGTSEHNIAAMIVGEQDDIARERNHEPDYPLWN